MSHNPPAENPLDPADQSDCCDPHCKKCGRLLKQVQGLTVKWAYECSACPSSPLSKAPIRWLPSAVVWKPGITVKIIKDRNIPAEPTPKKEIDYLELNRMFSR